MAWFLVTPSAIDENEGNEILVQSLVCMCRGIGHHFSSYSFLEMGLSKGLKGLMKNELVNCCKNIQKQWKRGEPPWRKHGGEVDDFTRDVARFSVRLVFLQRIPRLGVYYYP